MKYSVCNELFGSRSLSEACAMTRRAGFSGMELAPYTIFGDFSTPAIARGLAAARAALGAEGLSFVGFHWLLAKPEGLHIASPDLAVRRRSRDHLTRLIEASGELGGGVLVLGSPKQRGSLPGQSREETTRILGETLASLASLARDCRSEILVEQLSPDQTDVINTMEEAANLVDSIGESSIGGMFDFHNATSESSSWRELIERYYHYIRHVHANEVDGRAPGSGRSDYRPSFEILRSRGYDRWLSIEIFETAADPASILRASMSLFMSLEERGDEASDPCAGGKGGKA
jgi:D-psicose/D-tagatose/L-ribulose 3-epimerase